MYTFILISSLYIFYLIYKFHFKYDNIEEIQMNSLEHDYLVNPDNYFLYIKNIFPKSHYYNRFLLFNFMSNKTNFLKLENIFDNSLHNKMIEVIDTNEILKCKYDELNEKLGDKLFSYDTNLSIPITINDKVFNTNFPYLNFVRWFIQNDYFLYISNLENEF